MKVGVVRIEPGPKGLNHWVLIYKDPVEKKWKYPRREGTFEEIQIFAAALSEKIKHEQYRLDLGMEVERAAPKAPKLLDGFKAAQADSSALDTHKDAREYWFNRFIDWLKEAHPEVHDWSGLRPIVLKEYLQHQCSLYHANNDKAIPENTLKQSIEGIRHAWRVMAENYPREVYPLRPISLGKLDVSKSEKGCLSLDQAALLLRFLEKYNPTLKAMATLQTYMGLRVWEAAFLLTTDISLSKNALRIKANEHHKKVKNKPSERILPIPQCVLPTIQAAMLDATKKGRTLLFVNTKGQPWTKDGLVQAWDSAFEHVSKKKWVVERKNGRKMTCNRYGLGRPDLAKYSARKLRSTFATMLIGHCHRSAKQAYMGHARTDSDGRHDTLGSHYEFIAPARLLEVARAVDELSQNHHKKPDDDLLED